MLIFSKPVFWENDQNVVQILVMPNSEVADVFDRKIAAQSEEEWPEENGHGAIYKIRAVKNSLGSWDAVVRCGFTGELLINHVQASFGPEGALRLAAKDLLSTIAFDIAENFAHPLEIVHE